jgi:putative ATP-binding cassette transporter
MYLYKIFFKNGFKKILIFSILSLFAGVLNSLLFIYINILITNLGNNKHIDLRLNTFLFLLLLVLSLYSKRFLSYIIIKFTQEKLYDLKAELTLKLIKANYIDVKEKREEIFNVLTRDIESISEAGNLITNIITSIIIVCFCFIYILFISVNLFLIALIVVLLGILIHKNNIKKLILTFNSAKDLSNQFVKHLNQINDGFKEIKISNEKGDDIYANFILVILNKYLKIITKSYTGLINSQYFGDLLFYLTIGFVLIFGSIFLNVKQDAIVSFIFVLLFISGPIQNIILQIPSIVEANVSAKKLFELGNQLEIKNNIRLDLSPEINRSSFDTLKLLDVKYKHISKQSEFEIGPINFEIKKNEIIFIHGGNGSGKTTLILCLLGIYKFNSGKILVNNEHYCFEYSSLFSVVFSDFFLFDRFYGNYNFDKIKAQEYLQLFDLESKVKISEFGFSDINLSLGQRKRLALIQALLENKSVIILDEWAADQDPHFREKFYTEILVVLKKEGRTIFAITHDDKFFYVADKLYKMEYGKLNKSTL